MFFLTWYLSLDYFFLYTGDPCEGMQSLLRQTKKSRCRPVLTLVKTVAQHNKALIVSEEVFEVFHKLLKSDEENATDDITGKQLTTGK